MKENEQGQTALHKATSYKRRAICCMLVASGAALTPEDDAGLTPRLLALQVEDYELAAYLESEFYAKHHIDVGLVLVLVFWVVSSQK